VQTKHFMVVNDSLRYGLNSAILAEFSHFS